MLPGYGISCRGIKTLAPLKVFKNILLTNLKETYVCMFSKAGLTFECWVIVCKIEFYVCNIYVKLFLCCHFGQDSLEEDIFYLNGTILKD